MADKNHGKLSSWRVNMLWMNTMQYEKAMTPLAKNALTWYIVTSQKTKQMEP